jgi:hypothetical protein
LIIWLFVNNALNCLLQVLHCLNEPSFIKDTELFEEQKIHLGENLVCNPLLLIYVLNDWNLYASFNDVWGKLFW